MNLFDLVAAMVAEAALCAHLAAAIGAVQVSGALGRAAGGAEGGAVLVVFVDDQSDEAGKQADEPPIQGRACAGPRPDTSTGLPAPSSRHRPQHGQRRRALQSRFAAGYRGGPGDDIRRAACLSGLNAVEQVHGLGGKPILEGAFVVIFAADFAKSWLTMEFSMNSSPLICKNTASG